MPDLDLEAIKARLAAASEPLHPDARMEAYYYEFDRTGIAAIDAILSAVAVAGKGAHHTQDWIATDDYGYYNGHPGLPPSSGGSAASLIRRTAVASAETIRDLQADLAALVAEVERLRAVADAAALLSAKVVTDPGWPRLRAALDALDAGGEGS